MTGTSTTGTILPPLSILLAAEGLSTSLRGGLLIISLSPSFSRRLIPATTTIGVDCTGPFNPREGTCEAKGVGTGLRQPTDEWALWPRGGARESFESPGRLREWEEEEETVFRGESMRGRRIFVRASATGCGCGRGWISVALVCVVVEKG